MAKPDDQNTPLLPSSSGRKRPQRPKGHFRDARKVDDRPAVLEYARPSKLSIQIAWKSWTSFCDDELPEHKDDEHDPIQEADRVDREVDVRTIRAFLGWLLDNRNFKQLDAVMSYCRHWRMACRHHLGRRIDDRIAKDMKWEYIHSTLKEEYELSEISQFRATMNDDDLLAVLHHHWAWCNDYYPIERQRIQHALLILLLAGTSARPGTIIEGGGYYDENDALKYSDIRLHLVRDPDNHDRKSLVVLITLRLMKGYRNRGSPPTFVFYEQPQIPAFCVVSHILALAFDDNAFLSPFIKKPEDIWKIDIAEHRKGIPIEFKHTTADVPLLRRAIRTSSGVITSSIKAAQFATMSKYNLRLGKSAGLEKPFRFYTLRRGAGHAINKNATEAERMQAMGHADPNIFRRHYLNQIVSTDTLACFLRTPSREGLMRLAGHMSLTRDVNAPTSLTEKQKQDIVADPALQAARATRDEARRDLLKEHKQLKDARTVKADGWATYQRLQRAAKALHVRLQTDLLKSLRTEFFATAGARYIEAQQCRDGDSHNSAQEALTPLGRSCAFDIEERNLLPSLLFPAKDLKPASTVDEWTHLADAVRALISLCRRCSRPSGAVGPVFEPILEEECHHDEQIVETYPIVVPGTVCLFCLGNTSLPSHARTYAYARRSSLARHVQQYHLRFIHERFLCPHPSCADRSIWLEDILHFKNHAAAVHNVLH